MNPALKTLPPPSVARVISYTRFSSKRQGAGHSKERQDEIALKWCEERGYELDIESSIHDPGFSAYSAAHVNKGGLGALQQAAIAKKLENTIILIEAFDRLSRLELPDAYELLLSLINNGVHIVTLTDGNPWNKETLKSMEQFMYSLMSLYRGHDESLRKSNILQKKFESARNSGNQSAFGSAPGWLSREKKTSPWVVNEEKASVVRKIFEMSAAGYGSKAICKRAVEENWIVPTRDTASGGRWHSRLPAIILKNSAVLGNHEHRILTYEAKKEHWHGKTSGIISNNYYPRIVSDELWAKSRASIETRRVAKRRDNHYYNIFSGLLYCGYCGAPMHRRTETQGYSKATLSCSDKISGHTSCPSGAAVTADAPLLEAIFSYKSSAALNDEYISALQDAESGLRDAERRYSNIVDLIAEEGKTKILKEKLDMLSLELTICETAYQTILRSRETQYFTQPSLEGNSSEFIVDAISKLYSPDLISRDFRASLHLKIARNVQRIFIWNYEVAVIQFKHTNEDVVVPLDYKRLPSRANKLAKYHRPAPPKNPPPQPNLDLAKAGELQLPEVRNTYFKQ